MEDEVTFNAQRFLQITKQDVDDDTDDDTDDDDDTDADDDDDDTDDDTPRRRRRDTSSRFSLDGVSTLNKNYFGSQFL